MLLSNFDEYISYARDPEDYAGFDGTVDDVMRGSGLLMIDGPAVRPGGRAPSPPRPSRSWSIARHDSRGPIRRALDAEAAAFGAFVEPRTGARASPTDRQRDRTKA